jgi:hypothetical protein
MTRDEDRRQTDRRGWECGIGMFRHFLSLFLFVSFFTWFLFSLPLSQSSPSPLYGPSFYLLFPVGLLVWAALEALLAPGFLVLVL